MVFMEVPKASPVSQEGSEREFAAVSEAGGKHIVLPIPRRVPRWHGRYRRHRLRHVWEHRLRLSQFIPLLFSVIYLFFSQPLVLSVLQEKVE